MYESCFYSKGVHRFWLRPSDVLIELQQSRGIQFPPIPLLTNIRDIEDTKLPKSRPKRKALKVKSHTIQIQETLNNPQKSF